MWRIAVAWCLMSAGLQAGEPPASDTPAEIATLVEQLDAERFTDREAASHALLAIGEPTVTALHQVLKQHASHEARLRAAEEGLPATTPAPEMFACAPAPSWLAQ